MKIKMIDKLSGSNETPIDNYKHQLEENNKTIETILLEINNTYSQNYDIAKLITIIETEVSEINELSEELDKVEAYTFLIFQQGFLLNLIESYKKAEVEYDQKGVLEKIGYQLTMRNDLHKKNFREKFKNELNDAETEIKNTVEQKLEIDVAEKLDQLFINDPKPEKVFGAFRSNYDVDTNLTTIYFKKKGSLDMKFFEFETTSSTLGIRLQGELLRILNNIYISIKEPTYLLTSFGDLKKYPHLLELLIKHGNLAYDYKVFAKALETTINHEELRKKVLEYGKELYIPDYYENIPLHSRMLDDGELIDEKLVIEVCESYYKNMLDVAKADKESFLFVIKNGEHIIRNNPEIKKIALDYAKNYSDIVERIKQLS